LVCRAEPEPWQECDPFSGGDERLRHLAVVDAIGDVRVEARVAAAAVDHPEAGAVGSEVSQQPALPAEVGERDRCDLSRRMTFTHPGPGEHDLLAETRRKRRSACAA